MFKTWSRDLDVQKTVQDCVSITVAVRSMVIDGYVDMLTDAAVKWSADRPQTVLMSTASSQHLNKSRKINHNHTDIRIHVKILTNDGKTTKQQHNITEYVTHTNCHTMQCWWENFYNYTTNKISQFSQRIVSILIYYSYRTAAFQLHVSRQLCPLDGQVHQYKFFQSCQVTVSSTLSSHPPIIPKSLFFVAANSSPHFSNTSILSSLSFPLHSVSQIIPALETVHLSGQIITNIFSLQPH